VSSSGRKRKEEEKEGKEEAEEKTQTRMVLSLSIFFPPSSQLENTPPCGEQQNITFNNDKRKGRNHER
jgi:hypothetical protein